MDYENLSGYSLKNLDKINVILGKNGCGKSYLLKAIEANLRGQSTVGKVRYITPERAGHLQYASNIEQALNEPGWLDNNRRNNQSENFKQQSYSLFRKLELLTLREIEREQTVDGFAPKYFQAAIDKMNTLLDRIKIIRSDNGFQIAEKDSDRPSSAQEISSGEAELVSLAIEFLSFSKECEPGKVNYLLVDEPDVHLHPDLQDRLAIFMSEICSENLYIILATHSTAFLGALTRTNFTKVAFMRRGDKELVFSSISEIHKRILPMFGAHPLSNIFNEAPILLVEGEDDERIWQKAVSSSHGKINVYPCVAESIDNLTEFETQANNIIESVYDNARGYSLRDRDSNSEDIEDVGNIIRMRLSCRASENLMLSDDVLKFAETNWNDLKVQIEAFVRESVTHRYHSEVEKFAQEGFDRKNADLKDIRMILTGFITKKPWEVLVGQTIASLLTGSGMEGDDSLKSYLGVKVCNELLEI